MKICIYRAGAVGGQIGGRLAHRGAEVSLVARCANAVALRDRGLRVETTEQTLD